MKLKTERFIAPSLLAADFSNLKEEITSLEKSKVEVLHFDVMDGQFVPNITMGPPIIKSLRKHSKLIFDAHLMIANADCYLEDFKNAGCDWVSVHVEACNHLHRTVTRIRELKMKAGVAICPGTSLSHLDAILDDVDFILVMTVNPGFGGQKFIENSISRIEEVKNKIGKRAIRLQVDGGIKLENISRIAKAGADTFVIGTGLLGQGDYSAQVKKLRKAIEVG